MSGIYGAGIGVPSTDEKHTDKPSCGVCICSIIPIYTSIMMV